MDALDLLRLQIEWGIDEALEDAPVDRLRPVPPAPATTPRQPPTPVVASRGSAAEHAAAASGRASSLEELRAALAGFDGCALRETATNLVFAEGDPATGLLLIGDPPGEAEDRGGTPFAGADGMLLETMLDSIGLTRRDLVLAPVIPWRPPGGRPPNPAEITVCLPFLHRLIALIAPRRLLLAGTLPARTMMGPSRRRTSPTWVDVAVPGVASPMPALSLPSPAHVRETPSARRDAWAALRLLRRSIDGDLTKL